MASSGDLLLNEKQKKSFVSLKDVVTITHTTASLAQVDEVLKVHMTRKISHSKIC